MESLIIDKEKLVNKIDNIINELNDIKNDIKKDIDLESLVLEENVKLDNKHKENNLLSSNIKSNQKEDINKGYKDFYDISGRPDIHI